MAKRTMSLGQRILHTWGSLEKFPGGKLLFSILFGLMVPYSGSVGSRIENLKPGHVIATIRDRRKLRNHLRSVHALALANLGELTSGLAMITGLTPDIRSIVTCISTEYHKKARGKLVAECTCDIPEVSGPTEKLVEATIRDSSGDLVATTRVTWLLDTRPQ